VIGLTDTSLIATHNGNYNLKVTDINGCSISVGININMVNSSITAGHNLLSLYPDPAGDKLFISWNSDSKSSRIDIYNVVGSLLHSTAIKREDLTEGLMISMLSPGIYFIRIQHDNGKWEGRFVKE
jgi:hypothetical protein